jgi:pimeloyl-ACP methyl ester carboxylesterase
MPYLEAPDGTPLHYVDVGPRRDNAIFLIHAEPFSLRFWDRNIPDLAAQHRVVAVDVRGRGESGKTDFGHSIGSFARDFRFFLDALGLKRVVAVGWSLGGSILWSFMEQFGQERIAGYVNVDQAPRRFVSEEHLEARRNSIRTRRLAHHTEAILGYFGPEAEHDDATVRWMVYECMKTPTPYHIAAVTDSYHSDFTGHMSTVAVPTQIYWARYGTVDGVMAGAMQEAMRDSELVYFETCGHLIPWVEAEKFNRELARFASRTLA